MEKYSEYKDSGVQWLGEIPSHWKLLRNKSFMNLTDEKVEQRKNFILLSLTKQGVIIRDLSEGKGKFPKNFNTYLVVRPNNLVFCLFDVDETPRTVGLVRNVGMLTGAYTNFKLKENVVLPEYAYYYYLQVDDVKGLKPYYTGLRKVVKTNTFLQLRMPVPPIKEQHAIVSYLDTKCSKLDTFISNKEKEITFLQEMKLRVITDAVTRGLNPNVKFKPTNIPWLPEIPEYWKIKRAKNMFKKEQRPILYDDEIVTCFRDGEVTLRKNRRTSGFTEATDYSHYQHICKGDLVIHQMDAFAGSSGVSDSDGMGTPVLSVCTPKIEGIDNYYYAHVLRIMGKNGFILSLYRGIRERSSDFRFDTFIKQWLPVPPIEEQHAIVSYITERVAKIDSLLEKLNKEIECIKEYKQRLISDVVTGQIKVS